MRVLTTDVAHNLKFGPNSKFRVLSPRDAFILLGTYGDESGFPENDRCLVQMSVRVRDTRRRRKFWLGREEWFPLSYPNLETALADIQVRLIHEFMKHEADELTEYLATRPFDPHKR